MTSQPRLARRTLLAAGAALAAMALAGPAAAQDAAADAIHQRVLVLDSHVDVLQPGSNPRSFDTDGKSYADLEKLRAGGVDALVYAVAVSTGPRTAEGALANFDKANLTALQETETALTQYARELDRRASLRRARDEGVKAVRLARLRNEAGVDSLLTLLVLERNLAQLEAQLAQSDAQVTTNQIALFKALGGGWTQS